MKSCTQTYCNYTHVCQQVYLVLMVKHIYSLYATLEITIHQYCITTTHLQSVCQIT